MKLKYRKKRGRILERGEEFFWLARIYTPVQFRKFEANLRQDFKKVSELT